METKKVTELALDLSIDAKELLVILKEIGIAGKSAKSKLEQNELDAVFAELTKKIAVESIEKIITERG